MFGLIWLLYGSEVGSANSLTSSFLPRIGSLWTSPASYLDSLYLRERFANVESDQRRC